MIASGRQKRLFVTKILAALLISTLAITSSAQQVAPLSKKAAAVKQKADSLKPRDPISVVRIHEEEEFGTFISSGHDSFTFYDVDRKAEVTLNYFDVRKIKDGYGGYNHLRHRHTDRTKALIVGVVVVGGLLGLVFAEAKAD